MLWVTSIFDIALSLGLLPLWERFNPLLSSSLPPVFVSALLSGFLAKVFHLGIIYNALESSLGIEIIFLLQVNIAQ